MTATNQESHKHPDVCPFIWMPDIVERIAMFMSPNDIACNLRPVNKATAKQFRSTVTVRLSLSSPDNDFALRWGVPGALRGLTFQQRRQLLVLTASSGSIQNLKLAFKAVAETLTDEVFDLDNIESATLCQWLYDRGCWWLDEVCAAAAGAGHQTMCEWLLACGCPVTGRAVHCAACGGHLDLMEWLLQQRPELRSIMTVGAAIHRVVVCNAAEGCDLAALKLLVGTWFGGQLEGDLQQTLLLRAASSPTRDWQAKVEWLESLGSARGCKLVCQLAAGARTDAVGRLAWLRARGYPVDGWAVVKAAEAGNLAALRYLLGECSVPLEDMIPMFAVNAAAAGGHVAVLQALLTALSSTPPGDTAQGAGSGQSASPLGRARLPGSPLVKAAERGHLAVVVWLVETFGFRLTDLISEDLLFAAARAGSLPLVQWLLDRGCPPDWDLVVFAAESGCEELLEWLVVAQDYPYRHEAPYIWALQNRDLATLRCLHRLGVPMKAGEPLYTEAARTADLATLRCLHSQLHYPWSPTEQTFEEWIRGGRSPAVLRWLAVEAGCPVDWRSARLQAGAEFSRPEREELERVKLEVELLQQQRLRQRGWRVMLSCIGFMAG